MTAGLAGTRVGPGRRPGASVDATAIRPRRSGAVGALRVRRAYRPSLLSWMRGEPTPSLIVRMRRAALEEDRRSLFVSLDSASQMLLIPEESPGRPGHEGLDAVLRSVLAAARVGGPAIRIQALVGDRIPAGEDLATAAARLRRLASRTLAGPADEIVWARRQSLSSLLGTLEPRDAAAFVDEHLASLRAYDREHGTNLQRVLELALDHRDRGTAASAAFMHRNTFRRQLAKALGLVGVDLEDPESRLALHIALKLRGAGV